QSQRGAAQNVSVLRPLQFLADERGAFQAHLHRGVPAGLQPPDELGDLRGTARAVRALHDDEFADEFLELHAGDAVAVKAALRRRQRVGGFGGFSFHAAMSPSTSSGCELPLGRIGGGSGNGLCRRNSSRSIRSLTSRRTTVCCVSTRWLASMTVKL